MHSGPVGQAMGHPVVAYQVAVGRYVQEAGRPVEVVDLVVVLDLAGQAGELAAEWLVLFSRPLMGATWGRVGLT